MVECEKFILTSVLSGCATGLLGFARSGAVPTDDVPYVVVSGAESTRTLIVDDEIMIATLCSD